MTSPVFQTGTFVHSVNTLDVEELNLQFPVIDCSILPVARSHPTRSTNAPEQGLAGHQRIRRARQRWVPKRSFDDKLLTGGPA